jgi:dihydrofolate reductase
VISWEKFRLWADPRLWRGEVQWQQYERLGFMPDQLLYRRAAADDRVGWLRMTAGGTVIMGRSTWESIPQRFRPLPGRRNIVLSRQPGFTVPGAEVAATVEAGLAMALKSPTDAPSPSTVFIIGGAQVYAAALPLAHRLELTEIQHDFQGDAHFPGGWRQAFEEVSRRRVRTAAPNGFDIDFVAYQRRC